MAKSNITKEEARAVIDRVAEELKLLVNKASGFLKIEGPTNKHRIYVMESKKLGRIDTTLDLPKDDPAYVALSGPNGAIRCHIAPDLAHLERCLRMLGDASLDKQVSNKPRPFGVQAQPKTPARTPRPTAPVVDVAAVIQKSAVKVDGLTLEERLEYIRKSSQRAKVRLLVEERGLPEELAERVVKGEIELDEALQNIAGAEATTVNEVLAESGVEVS